MDRPTMRARQEPRHNRPRCFVCDTSLHIEVFAANVDNTTGKVIAPDAAPEHGQYGFLPVGGGCRRKLIAGGVPADWFIKED